jgi:hypothetical protein
MPNVLAGQARGRDTYLDSADTAISCVPTSDVRHILPTDLRHPRAALRGMTARSLSEIGDLVDGLDAGTGGDLPIAENVGA